MTKDKVIELSLKDFLELVMGPGYDPASVDKIRNVIQHRYDWCKFFDVRNGNPNGDPDAGNAPRIDPETLLGIITDVCIKRKIRDFIDAMMNSQSGYRLYIKNDAYLNAKDEEAFSAVGVKKDQKMSKTDAADIERKLTRFMCDNFYDVRTFGAVMTSFSKAFAAVPVCAVPSRCPAPTASTPFSPSS